MKYKLFPAQFFYQFMQPSPPPIVKLKYLNDVMRGQHKNGPMPLKLAPPHMITSKSLPNLHALRSPINMITMIRQHKKFPPTAR